jgi:hypothetical protein
VNEKKGRNFLPSAQENGNSGFVHSKASNNIRKVILQGSHKCLQRYYILRQFFIAYNVFHLQKRALGASLRTISKITRQPRSILQDYWDKLWFINLHQPRPRNNNVSKRYYETVGHLFSNAMNQEQGNTIINC